MNMNIQAWIEEQTRRIARAENKRLEQDARDLLSVGNKLSDLIIVESNGQKQVGLQRADGRIDIPTKVQK
jgi:hypothetical protein